MKLKGFCQCNKQSTLEWLIFQVESLACMFLWSFSLSNEVLMVSSAHLYFSCLFHESLGFYQSKLVDGSYCLHPKPHPKALPESRPTPCHCGATCELGGTLRGGVYFEISGFALGIFLCLQKSEQGCSGFS